MSKPTPFSRRSVKPAHSEKCAVGRIRTWLRRCTVRITAPLLPEHTANRLAHRFLSSSYGFLDDLAHSHSPPDIVHLAPDLAVLRHAPQVRPPSPPTDVHAPRVLIVPGHNVHFTQFNDLVSSLTQTGIWVDLLVLPGHLHADRSVCAISQIVDAILWVARAQGPYDGMMAHCVGANAALFALDAGLYCPRLALVSMPLDLPRLVRLRGTAFGLRGRCLDRFVEAVDAMGHPYHLDTPWYPIAVEREEAILALHASDDFAAPVEHMHRFTTLSPGAQIVEVDGTGHNAILRNRRAITRITEFLTQPVPSTRPAPTWDSHRTAQEKAGPQIRRPAGARGARGE